MKGRKKGLAMLAALALLALLALGISFAVYLTGGREEIAEIPEETKAQTEEIRISQTEEESTKAFAETEKETEYVSPIDFQALWAVNPDVVGWITIPDTRIDYPILQGKDNDQYLHTDMEGNETVAGEIFLDFEDEGDFSSLHNVIYGHHMKNGTMFKDITRFTDLDYLKGHKEITIWTKEDEISLEPVFCYTGEADGSYRSLLDSGKELEAFLLDKTGFRISSDNVFVFITCSYEQRDGRCYLICSEAD